MIWKNENLFVTLLPTLGPAICLLKRYKNQGYIKFAISGDGLLSSDLFEDISIMDKIYNFLQEDTIFGMLVITYLPENIAIPMPSDAMKIVTKPKKILSGFYINRNEKDILDFSQVSPNTLLSLNPQKTLGRDYFVY